MFRVGLNIAEHGLTSLNLCWFSHSVVSNPCDPMDCSLPGSSIHGIFQARIMEWVAISFSIQPCWGRKFNYMFLGPLGGSF